MNSINHIEQLNKEKAIEKLKRLSTQLNPHFFFNSLNSVQYNLLENNTSQAIEYIGMFSKLMRQVLDNSMRIIIPIKEEITFLKTYLELEEKRLLNSFKYSISCLNFNEDDEVFVPPMILQPIIENAILHGIRSRKEGTIDITFKKESKWLICTVIDNGGGFSNAENSCNNSKQHKSYGLAINRERLKILKEICKENSFIEIKNRTLKNGVKVKICIPLSISELNCFR